MFIKNTIQGDQAIMELSKEDIQKVKNKADEHYSFFNRIINSMSNGVEAEEFITCIINDYLWDVNLTVVRSLEYPENDIKNLWDNSADQYVNELAKEELLARDFIINTLIVYTCNKEKILNNNEEINDILNDYYLSEGIDYFFSKKYKYQLLQLTQPDLILLNKILSRLGMKKISMGEIKLVKSAIKYI